MISVLNNKKAFIPAVLILAAIAVSIVLGLLKEDKGAVKRLQTGVLVETTPARFEDIPLAINGSGIVKAVRESVIAPQVSGKINYVSPKFVEGGFLKSGEAILGIEPQDFEIAVDLAEADVVQAKKDFQLAKADAQSARTEWKSLKEDLDLDKGEQEPSQLTLKEPQLKSSQARLKAAKAKSRQAVLNLERTKIIAPYDGFIQSKAADVGQYVRAGEVVGRFVGSREIEVLVSVSIDQLFWIRQAMRESDDLVKAKVILKNRYQTYHWEGYLDRILANISDKARMYKVAIRVSNPYGLDALDSKIQKPMVALPDFPLSVGSFVEVKIMAGTIPNAINIPASALHEGDTVWLAGENKQLNIKKVKVAWNTGKRVYISSGIEPGSQVITTKIAGAIKGLKIRVAERKNEDNPG